MNNEPGLSSFDLLYNSWATLVQNHKLLGEKSTQMEVLLYNMHSWLRALAPGDEFDDFGQIDFADAISKVIDTG